MDSNSKHTSYHVFIINHFCFKTCHCPSRSFIFTYLLCPRCSALTGISRFTKLLCHNINDESVSQLWSFLWDECMHQNKV